MVLQRPVGDEIEHDEVVCAGGMQLKPGEECPIDLGFVTEPNNSSAHTTQKKQVSAALVGLFPSLLQTYQLLPATRLRLYREGLCGSSERTE